jgi:hypothetical protein
VTPDAVKPLTSSKYKTSSQNDRHRMSELTVGQHTESNVVTVMITVFINSLMSNEKNYKRVPLNE